ncbi:Ion channel, partial [Teladorsagia circumcincta]
ATQKRRKEGVPARKAELDSRIMEIVMRYKRDSSNITLPEKTAALKKDYVAMLNSDGLFKWSTYYKTDEPDHWKWTFGSSYFYAMNVYTTVGYGSIAPDTFASRCFTMLYGAIFCPMTWIIIRDLGQLALVYLTTVYARLKLRFTNAGEKADQVFMVPISLCLGICILIMLFGTLWVHSYDALSGPPGSGLDWFLSLYFTFQTFTTIGLGDVMPNNIPAGTGSSTIGADDEAVEEADITNQLTIHSIATFMQSNADVYGGLLGLLIVDQAVADEPYAQQLVNVDQDCVVTG